MSRALDGQAIKEARAELVARTDLTGRSLARRLAEQADAWFDRLAGDLPPGWVLLATGGYAGGALCPGSDIDVVLLHPPRVTDAGAAEVAEPLWYPIWDSGVKLSPAVHSTRSLLALAADDLVTATSLLRMRAVAGDGTQVAAIRQAAHEQWRKRSTHWLVRLLAVSEERWAHFGEVASLLEPDLKDGRGGLRDHDVLRWAVATDRQDVIDAQETPLDELVAPADLLLTARCEVHRVTGRNTNVLLLQDQDAVADALGFADADVAMLRIAGAARSIEWASARFWRRIERLLARRGRRAATGTDGTDGTDGIDGIDGIDGVEIVDDEVDVTAAADFDDQSLVFRVAAASARTGLQLSRHALLTLAANVPTSPGPWADPTRRAFVSLLGSGTAMVSTVEALEHHDLFSRFVPEWRHVRSRPQRNAFHLYTVDRHLLITVANATELLRDVSRPDLLLVAALTHDIGKGRQGDHTEVGLALLAEMLPRMGFSPGDASIVSSLVEHHLLLSETALRRDLGDPRTIANVADAIGDRQRLELLKALTQADSLATGPSAWSDWKRMLIDELVGAADEMLRGEAQPDERGDDSRFGELVALVRDDGALHTEHATAGETVLLSVAVADQPGLFAKVAGTLAVHGIEVLAAEAWTSSDGIAVDQFQIAGSPHRPVDFARVHHDLAEVLAGRADVDARLRARIREHRRAVRRAVAASPPRLEVLISNAASDSTTMIDVRAPDAPAVLYRLSSTLAGCGVDIRSAKVATLGHEVVDVFYVQQVETDSPQLPAHLHPDIRARLCAALADGG